MTKRWEGKTYTFYKADDGRLPEGTFKIKGLYDDGGYPMAANHSLFIGKALTLFGNPDYVTPNNEDLLSYTVAAEDKDGNVLYMEVYYGPSGPAIGGLHGEDYAQAAEELCEIIMAASASDFEMESTYEDVGVTIKMGVKDGKPYYDTVFPEGMFEE